MPWSGAGECWRSRAGSHSAELLETCCLLAASLRSAGWRCSDLKHRSSSLFWAVLLNLIFIIIIFFNWESSAFSWILANCAVQIPELSCCWLSNVTCSFPCAASQA